MGSIPLCATPVVRQSSGHSRAFPGAPERFWALPTLPITRLQRGALRAFHPDQLGEIPLLVFGDTRKRSLALPEKRMQRGDGRHVRWVHEAFLTEAIWVNASDSLICAFLPRFRLAVPALVPLGIFEVFSDDDPCVCSP